MQQSGEGLQFTLPKLARIVDDYVALMSHVPDIKVITPSFQPRYREIADRNERVLYGVWSENDIGIKIANLNWYNSLFGAGVIKCQPNLNGDPPVIITVEDPRNVFPLIYNNQVRDVFFKYEFEGRVINQMFPESNSFDDGSIYELYDYWDTKERVLFTLEETGKKDKNGKRDDMLVLSQIDHDLGFVPCIWGCNRPFPVEQTGRSDVENLPGITQYLSDLFSYTEDVIAYLSDPKLVLEGPLGRAQDIEPGRGGVIRVERGGKAYFVEMPSSSRELLNHVKTVSDIVEDLSGRPGVLTNRMTSRSSRSLAGASTMLTSNLGLKQMFLGNSLSKMNVMIFRILEKFFKDKPIFYAPSIKTKRPLTVKGSAIHGIWRNTIIFKPAPYDYGQQLSMELRKYGAKLQSPYTTMENMGIEDPYQEAKDILSWAEQLRKVGAGIPGEKELGRQEGEAERGEIHKVPEELKKKHPKTEKAGKDAGEKKGRIILADIINCVKDTKLRKDVFIFGGIAQLGYSDRDVDVMVRSEADQKAITEACKEVTEKIHFLIKKQGTPKGSYLIVKAR